MEKCNVLNCTDSWSDELPLLLLLVCYNWWSSHLNIKHKHQTQQLKCSIMSYWIFGLNSDSQEVPGMNKAVLQQFTSSTCFGSSANCADVPRSRPHKAGWAGGFWPLCLTSLQPEVIGSLKSHLSSTKGWVCAQHKNNILSIYASEHQHLVSLDFMRRENERGRTKVSSPSCIFSFWGRIVWLKIMKLSFFVLNSLYFDSISFSFITVLLLFRALV